MDLHPPSDNGHDIYHTHYSQHHQSQGQPLRIVADPTPVSTIWPQSIHARALQQANLRTSAVLGQSSGVGNGHESTLARQGASSGTEVGPSDSMKPASSEESWSPDQIFNFDLAGSTDTFDQPIDDGSGSNTAGLSSGVVVPAFHEGLMASSSLGADHLLVQGTSSINVAPRDLLFTPQQLGRPTSSTPISPSTQFRNAVQNLGPNRSHPTPRMSPQFVRAPRPTFHSRGRILPGGPNYAPGLSAHIPRIPQAIPTLAIMIPNVAVAPALTTAPLESPSITPRQDRIVKLQDLAAPSQALQDSAPLFGVTAEASPIAGPSQVFGPNGGTGGQAHIFGWVPAAGTSVDVTLEMEGASGMLMRHSPRKRKRLVRSDNAAEISDSDLGLAGESDADNDSDVYQPSGREKRLRPKRSTALKGSEALAILTAQQRIEEENDDDEYGSRSSRKGRNLSIPQPVPVPNLTKKSRGRKVPYIIPSSSTNRSSQHGSSSNSGGEGRQDSEVGEEGAERSFICSECGRCFIRGEHLKRHVRSIHTNDKPYPCPYEGCDKAFSRRDNLSQHVRVHLP